jgi:hypothetical protein
MIVVASINRVPGVAERVRNPMMRCDPAREWRRRQGRVVERESERGRCELRDYAKRKMIGTLVDFGSRANGVVMIIPLYIAQ